MTLTPITIRMCQLLNLPEIPFLFSQFFAGNIWAVTLVTGNVPPAGFETRAAAASLRRGAARSVGTRPMADGTRVVAHAK